MGEGGGRAGREVRATHTDTRMRALLLVTFLLALPACDFLGPQGVQSASIQRVLVEELDLDQPWDNPLTNDLPDVYVDINDEGGAIFSPEFRSDVQENVDALPLTFAASGEYAVPLDAMARLSVADRDFAGDDEMFSSGPFTFGERYTGQEIGETTSLKFENEEGRVWIFVRWE